MKRRAVIRTATECRNPCAAQVDVVLPVGLDGGNLGSRPPLRPGRFSRWITGGNIQRTAAPSAACAGESELRRASERQVGRIERLNGERRQRERCEYERTSRREAAE